MASGYANIPLIAAGTWKDSVDTAASLPASNNTAGDARVTRDTGLVYAWDGAEWVSPGAASGITTVGAFGSSPTANAASISGVTLTFQPADATHPGSITAGTQTIGGAKTFASTIAASNLSGTNTGDITLGTFGSSPTAKGASLSGQALTLQPADITNPGSIMAVTQVIGGGKTISGNADEVQLAAKAFAGQTSNIFEVQDSSGGASFFIDKDGVCVGTFNAPAFTGPLTAPGYYSSGTNPANAGLLQLTKDDAINWRNNNNDNDLGISLDASDVFQLSSSLTVTGTITASIGLAYTTASSSYWATSSPTTVKAALDRIAKAVSQNGVAPIPT